MLSIEELLELEDNIKAELDEYLTAALSKLNRSGQLEEFIELLGMEHLLQKESGYEVYKTGKIVVIGQSDVKFEDIKNEYLSCLTDNKSEENIFIVKNITTY